MKKYRSLFIVTTALITLIILIGLGLLWSWNTKVQKDQDTARQDVVGKEFMALYPDSYNYEFTNSQSIHLNAIPDGTINIVLVIPRDNNAEKYTLTCESSNGTKQYFSLNGKSDAMIDAITNRSCFNQ